jgi:hypothetical protein
MSSHKPSLVAGKPGKDPVLPKVPITLGGKERHLIYDFNALAVAEQMTGMNLFTSFDFTNLSASRFRAMLFASLLVDSPDITLEECGQFITVHSLPEITIKMVEAWHGSRPEVKEAEAEAELEDVEGDEETKKK